MDKKAETNFRIIIPTREPLRYCITNDLDEVEAWGKKREVYQQWKGGKLKVRFNCSPILPKGTQNMDVNQFVANLLDT
jgi:hypothetical protein